MKGSRDVPNQAKKIDSTLVHSLFWENARDILLIIRANGRIIDANRKAVEAYGYGRNELLSLRIHDLRDPATVPLVDGQMVEASREGVLFDTVHRRKDGSTFPVEVSSRGAVIGSERVLLSIIRDVTVRKEAESRIADALEFNRKVLDASPLCILAYDASGQCISANSATGNIIGATREQILAQNFREIEPFRRTGLARLAEAALESGTERWMEMRTVSTFGKEVWLECRLVPFTSRGEPHLLLLCTDLKERREAEEALRVSTESLSALVRNAPLAIVVFDEAGVIQMWNPAAERMFGWSAEEAIGRVHPIVPEDKLEEFRAFRETALKGKSFTGVELRRRRKDGSPIDISVSTSPVRGAGTPITGIMSIITDISERRRAEDALVRRGRQLEILSAATQRINAVLDIPVILRTLVTSAIELVEAASGTAGLVGDGKMVFSEYIREGAVVPIDYVFEPGSGVPGHVMDTKDPYISNDPAGDPHVLPEVREALGFENLINVPILSRERDLIGCFEIHNKREGRPFGEQDIVMLNGLAAGAAVALENARMLAEQEAAKRELQRLATAVEQSAEAIMITDASGVIEYVNPAFERITGYGRGEAVGKNPRILKSGRQDSAFYADLWGTLLRGDPWTGVFINCRKDGTQYEEEAVISPVRDAAGRVVNYVAVKRDVTNERHVEEQLRQAQKMEAVGRLAGGIAHDFNNLLTAVTGYSDLLLLSLREGDPARREVEEIRKAGDRAAGLTRQLLAFSRRQVLQPKVLDLNRIVTNMETMLRRLIGEDIELITSLPDNLGRVKADPGQIEQVIVNLAVNSRDAMPKGGKLILETANVELDDTYVSRHDPVQPGSYVMLAVTDTGCGMDEETMTRLFEPFYTTKEVGKGTGLGLATVYGIVKQSGGYIWAYSEPGRGTTFKVYLPREEMAAEPVLREAVPVYPSEGQETVLVAEDERMVRELVREILVQNGYEVLEAHRGTEALEVSERHKGPIHLLITDVVMPGMSGPELAMRLAARRPDMRVLYMSGYTDDAIHHHGVLEPGMQYLQKPFTAAALSGKVRAVLDGRPDV